MTRGGRPTTSPSEVLLRPIELPRSDVLDDDLVTIPKYRGKTNELFTACCCT
nr:hypothetical protein [Propionibacterium freudenreichii]